jgi:hypothetical protein
MKTLVLAAAAVLALASGAFAQNNTTEDNTNCTRIGRYVYCTSEDSDGQTSTTTCTKLGRHTYCS